MPKKVYKVNTTDGPRWAVGVFSGGEMLAGSSPKYYKTKKGASKNL